MGIQKSVFITGNDLFDVILNEKLQNLTGNVRILVTGKVISRIEVDDVNLCTIFSNLIDNAVEAVENGKRGEAYIIVNFRSGHEFLQITIRNSTDKRLKFGRDGLPKTTKHDGTNHGIGLYNVRNAIRKCSGVFSCGADDQEFCVEVTLPLRKN